MIDHLEFEGPGLVCEATVGGHEYIFTLYCSFFGEHETVQWDIEEISCDAAGRANLDNDFPYADIEVAAGRAFAKLPCGFSTRAGAREQRVI